MKKENNGIEDRIGKFVNSSIENAARDAVLLEAVSQIKSTRSILEQDGRLYLNIGSLYEKERGILSIVLILLI